MRGPVPLPATCLAGTVAAEAASPPLRHRAPDVAARQQPTLTKKRSRQPVKSA
jgi:hypothetical protein